MKFLSSYLQEQKPVEKIIYKDAIDFAKKSQDLSYQGAYAYLKRVMTSKEENHLICKGSQLGFTQAINTGLQQLVLNKDITNFESRISFTVAGKQVTVDLSITPAFSANSISVNLGYFLG